MLRHTVRSLLKSPGFTFISIAALAVGIGGNTALFGLVNAVILRAAPYRDPGRLVMIWQQTPSGDKNGVSAGDFLDWREWTKSFTQIAAFTGEGFNLVDGDRAEKLAGLRVSSSLFSILGNMPTIGRAFSPEDEKPGSNLTVILSDGFWMRRFGGDPHAVGKTIRLNEQTYTIIGVMPRGFEFWGKTDLWAPLALQRDRAKRNFYYLAVLARLRPDVTVNQARAEMAALARQLALDYPKTNIGWGAQVVPLAEQLAGDARTPLLVL